MSRAFTISAAVGFGVSLLAGYPLATALLYGLISGAIGALINELPEDKPGVAYFRRSRPVVYVGGFVDNFRPRVNGLFTGLGHHWNRFTTGVSHRIHRLREHNGIPHSQPTPGWGASISSLFSGIHARTPAAAGSSSGYIIPGVIIPGVAGAGAYNAHRGMASAAGATRAPQPASSVPGSIRGGASYRRGY